MSVVHAAKEPRFTAAAVYQPPTFGRSPPDIPETPEAPPALQALQALRGGRRRPGPGGGLSNLHWWPHLVDGLPPIMMMEFVHAYYILL